mmetsp:Transcript_18768/g.32071  ORF Transcript_18768/g.32071 Transcript_18768/m.32071 type:complete len:168 (-) Transcript_18768:339-842(-)
MKVWDISEVDLDDQTTENKFIELYFIIAHKSIINTIEIVEEKNITSDRFIITASNDNNINLHRLSSGVFVGQFGQAHGWNIHDMSPYEKRKPRYVREWYLKLKQRMKARKQKEIDDEQRRMAKQQSLVQSQNSPMKMGKNQVKEEAQQISTPSKSDDNSDNFRFGHE